MVASRAGKETKRRGKSTHDTPPTFEVRLQIQGASPLQRAFFERVMGSLTRFAKGGDVSLAMAMSAPTDVGTLAYVASDLAGSPAVTELDPTAALLAEGARLKQELLARAGGAMGASDVAKILGISRQAVDKRRLAHRLIAVSRGHNHVYPAAQFGDGGLVPGLDKVLAAMPIRSPWMRLEWLITPDDALEGISPLEALKAGRLDDVIANASGHGG